MNKILNLKFLIIAGSIFLGTLVVLLTTGIYNPSWNPFTFASQRNLNKAIGKMTTLDNLKTQGNVWVEVTTVDKEKKPITLNFSFNPSVSADFKNKKGLSDFNLTGEIGGLSVSFDGEIRLVNDEFYFQIKNLSVLLSYMGMGKFQDKWIKLSSTSTPAEGEKNQGKEKIKEFFKEVMNELKRKEIIKVKRNLGEEKVDGIQCSHYLVILDNKNLKDIALRPYDIYLTYWIDQIFPIYDEEGNYEKFREANKWIQEFLPNSFGVKVGFRRKVKLPFIIYKIKKILEMLHSYSFNGITEKFYKWLELKIMSRRLKEMANKDTRVIVNDKMLKFHDNDRREETRRIFEERLIELETAE